MLRYISFESAFVFLLKKNDIKNLLQINSIFLTTKQKQYVDFVGKYYTENQSVFPSLQTLFLSFPELEDFRDDEYKLTSIEIIEQVVASYQNNRINQIIQEIKEETTKGIPIDVIYIDKLRKINEILNYKKTKPLSFSDFDLEIMFKNKKRTVFPSKSIDKQLGGLLSGDVLTILGEEGTGKTNILIDIAYKIVKTQKKKIMIYSAEMDKFAMMSRMNSFIGHYDSFQIRQMLRSTIAISKVSKMIYNTFSGELYFPEKIADIFDLIEEVRENKPDIVVLDSAYFIRGKSDDAMGWKDIAIVMETIKSLANNYNCVFILSSQLQRGLANKKIEEITLDNIAFAKTISQTSDFVYILKEVKMPVKEESKKFLLGRFLKNRNSNNSVLSKVVMDFKRMDFTYV